MNARMRMLAALLLLPAIFAVCDDSTCAEETRQQRVDRNSVLTPIHRDIVQGLREDGWECLITSTTLTSDLYTCTRCI